MKRALLIAAALSGLSTFGLAALAHDGAHKETEKKPTTIVGELIDAACFTASDGEAKGTDHASCAKECLASGIPAGLLPEGKGRGDLLILLTNPKPFADYAAQTVKVEGVVHDKLVDVKKAYVKDGAGWKEIKLDDAHHKMAGGEGEKTTGDAPKPASDGHSGHKH